LFIIGYRIDDNIICIYDYTKVIVGNLI